MTVQNNQIQVNNKAAILLNGYAELEQVREALGSQTIQDALVSDDLVSRIGYGGLHKAADQRDDDDQLTPLAAAHRSLLKAIGTIDEALDDEHDIQDLLAVA